MNASTATEPQFEDVAEFATNMTRFYETSQEIAHLYMETHQPSLEQTEMDPLNLLPTFANLAGSFASNPNEMLDLGMKYWSGQMAIWQDAASKILGGESAESADIPNLPEGGKRFAHPQWTENAALEYVKRSYLLAAEWARGMVESADDALDAREKRKVEFLTRNIIDAMNPANFAHINPGGAGNHADGEGCEPCARRGNDAGGHAARQGRVADPPDGYGCF